MGQFLQDGEMAVSCHFFVVVEKKSLHLTKPDEINYILNVFLDKIILIIFAITNSCQDIAQIGIDVNS